MFFVGQGEASFARRIHPPSHRVVHRYKYRWYHRKHAILCSWRGPLRHSRQTRRAISCRAHLMSGQPLVPGARSFLPESHSLLWPHSTSPGLRAAWQSWRALQDDDDDDEQATGKPISVMTVAAVTFANGGDRTTMSTCQSSSLLGLWALSLTQVYFYYSGWPGTCRPLRRHT